MTARPPIIWFNHGYASVRDAVTMIADAANGRVRCIASHSDPTAAVLDAADDAFVEAVIDRTSTGGQAAYAEYCLAQCRARGVDLFVPQRGREAIAARRDDFAAVGTRLSVAGSPDTLALLADKGRFHPVATVAGIAMPSTRFVNDLAGFDAALAALAARGLPACVKPTHGVFGAGFWQLDRKRSLFSAMMDSENRCIDPAAMRGAIGEAGAVKLLVMEFLGGPEWSVDCLAREGRLILGIARHKLGRAQRIETQGQAIDIARDTVRVFGLSGLINVQCRAVDEHARDVRLLEINARMSGGCHYTAHSGVNLPWWHVALELGLADEADLPMPVAGALVAAIAGSVRLADDAAARMPEYA